MDAQNLNGDVMQGEEDSDAAQVDVSIGNITSSDSSELAIMYGGSVRVFSSMTPEKVHVILLIAAAAEASAATLPSPQSSSSEASPTNILSAQPQQPALLPGAMDAMCRLQRELPLARRNSLQRFLEKRRERLVRKNPYPTASGGSYNKRNPPSPPSLS